MNRTCPGCIRSYSTAIGSFTFKIISASDQTLSGPVAMVAPAAANSASVIEEPSPASDSTLT